MATLYTQKYAGKIKAPNAVTPIAEVKDLATTAYKDLVVYGVNKLGSEIQRKIDEKDAAKKVKEDEKVADKLTYTNALQNDLKIDVEKQYAEEVKKNGENDDFDPIKAKVEVLKRVGSDTLLHLAKLTENDVTSIVALDKSITDYKEDIIEKGIATLEKTEEDALNENYDFKEKEWAIALQNNTLTLDEVLLGLDSIAKTKPFVSMAERQAFIAKRRSELIKINVETEMAKDPQATSGWFVPYDPSIVEHKSKTKHLDAGTGIQYVASAAAPAGVHYLQGDDLTKVFNQAYAAKNNHAKQLVELENNRVTEQKLESARIHQQKEGNKQEQVEIIVSSLIGLPSNEQTKQLTEVMKQFYPDDAAKEEAGYKIALGLWNANRNLEKDPMGYFVKHNGVIAELNQAYEQALGEEAFEQAGSIRKEMVDVVVQLSESMEKDPKYILSTQELGYWRDKYEQGQQAEDANAVLAIFDQMEMVFGEGQYFDEALQELANDGADASRNPATRAISKLNLFIPQIPKYAQKAIAIDAQHSHAQFDDKYEIDEAKEHEVLETMRAEMAKVQFEGYEKYMQMELDELRLDPEFELAYRLAVSYQSNKMFMRRLQIPSAIHDVFSKSEAQKMQLKIRQSDQQMVSDE